MEREFKLVLSNDLFDKERHSHYHYYRTIVEGKKNAEIAGFQVHPASLFDEISEDMSAMGANLTEVYKIEGEVYEEEV